MQHTHPNEQASMRQRADAIAYLLDNEAVQVSDPMVRAEATELAKWMRGPIDEDMACQIERYALSTIQYAMGCGYVPLMLVVELAKRFADDILDA